MRYRSMQTFPRGLLFPMTAILGLGFAQQATGPNQQIDELRQQWVDLYNQGDMAAMVELYTEDGAIYDATGEVTEGGQAMQENLQGGV